MGKTAVIIGNGQFPRKEYPLYILSQADYIVCCDGAFRRYMKHVRDSGSGRLPDAIVGDMDSLSAADRTKYSHLTVCNPDQETNDQTKAFNYVADNFRDVSDIFFLAATGKREDHTIGNMSLLMEYARERDLNAMGLRIQMVSDYATIFPVTDSIQYPTDNVIFDNWWQATLNRAVEDTVRLTFSHPSIALIVLD